MFLNRQTDVVSSSRVASLGPEQSVSRVFFAFWRRPNESAPSYRNYGHRFPGSGCIFLRRALSRPFKPHVYGDACAVALAGRSREQPTRPNRERAISSELNNATARRLRGSTNSLVSRYSPRTACAVGPSFERDRLPRTVIYNRRKGMLSWTSYVIYETILHRL